MTQDINADADLDDDLDLVEDWDDLDEELEVFEDTSGNPGSKSSSEIISKSSKKKKKSGSGLLFGLISLATLGSVSWLVVNNNPALLTQVIEMTSGDKQLTRPVVSAEGQTELSVTSHEINSEAIFSQPGAVPTALQTPQPPAMPIIPGQQTEQVTADALPVIPAEVPLLPSETKNNEVSDNNSELKQPLTAEDSGILTPLPENSASEAQNLPDLSIADIPAETESPSPQDTPPVDSGDPVSESILTETQVPASDNLSNVSAAEPENVSDIQPDTLEEKKLLVQTEKNFDEIKPEEIVLSDISIETEDNSVQSVKIEAVPPSPPILDVSSENTENRSLENKETSEIQKQNASNTFSSADVSAPEKVLQEPDDLADNIKDPIKNVPKKSEPSVASAKDVKTSGETDSARTQVAAKKIEKQISPPKWQLRSASSGSAVIFDKKTGHVISVGVGSNVKGIGHVKSIEKRDGRWIVQGTSGVIRQ